MLSNFLVPHEEIAFQLWPAKFLVSFRILYKNVVLLYN